MRRANLTRGSLALVAALGLGCSTASLEQYPYVFLWREAQQPCQPKYPQSSVAAGHTGLGVLQLTVAPDGGVVKSVVLQAPDEQIGAALRACGEIYRGGRIRGSTALRQGKLFAYFVIEDGAGSVYVANDLKQKSELRTRLEQGRVPAQEVAR